MYTVIHNSDLYVSYRAATGDWPNTVYSYTIRKFRLSESNGNIAATQTGNDLTTTISGYGYGRMVYVNGKLYIHDANSLDIVNPSSMTIMKTLNFTSTLSDMTKHRGKLILSSFHLEMVNGKENTQNGGIFIVNGLDVSESVLGDYGVRKILSTGDDLFAIKWDGTGRTYNSSTWSYEWDQLTTSMVSINGTSMSSKFNDSGLTAISDVWVHFGYDDYEDVFLLTDAAYSNSKVRLVNSLGSEITSINLIGQTCQVLILK